MDNFRSRVSMVTIVFNALLYGILIALVAIKNIEILWIAIIVVVISVVLLVKKFLKPMYYFDNRGLTIIDKRNKYLIQQ